MSKFFNFFDTFLEHVDDIDMLREKNEGRIFDMSKFFILFDMFLGHVEGIDMLVMYNDN